MGSIRRYASQRFIIHALEFVPLVNIDLQGVPAFLQLSRHQAHFLSLPFKIGKHCFEHRQLVVNLRKLSANFSIEGIGKFVPGDLFVTVIDVLLEGVKLAPTLLDLPGVLLARHYNIIILLLDDYPRRSINFILGNMYDRCGSGARVLTLGVIDL